MPRDLLAASGTQHPAPRDLLAGGSQAYVRPNLSAIPLFGPALQGVGFDGMPRTDRAPDDWHPPGYGKASVPVLGPMLNSMIPAEKNTQTGEWRPAVPTMITGLEQSLMDAIWAPSDALAGKMDEVQFDPVTGEVQPFNDQTIQRSANLAGWATGRFDPGSPGHLATAAGTTVPKAVVRALRADGVPPNEAAARVNALGPEGIVADLGPNLQAQASALAGVPGKNSDAVIDALSARRAAAPARMRAGLDDTLGEAPIPSQLKAQIRESKRVVGPEYDVVLAAAAPVDTTALAASLDQQVGTLRGPAQTALRDVRGMLNATGTGELDTSAETLFQVRNAIDGMLENPMDPKVISVLKDARQEVDALLAAASPDIKAVDAKYRELSRQSDAVDAGQTVLDSSRDAPRPVELAQQAQEGAIPEGLMIGPSGATFRLSQGARAEIERVVGTNLNDRAALERLMKGDGDWNRARLVTLFGEDRANRLFHILENERRMAETETAALGAGAAVPKQAAKAEIAPDPKGPGVVQTAMNLKPGSTAAKVADNLFGGIGRARQSRINDDILGAIFGRGDFQTVGARQSQAVLPIEAILAAIADKRAQPQGGQSQADQQMLDRIFAK